MIDFLLRRSIAMFKVIRFYKLEESNREWKGQMVELLAENYEF